MPVQRVGPDANGLYFNAVGSAEWDGAYGVQLRSQGYTYCGYGTWGVYVAAPGQPCFDKGPGGVTQPPPPPGPMILPPVETTGGVGSPPAPVHVGCGCSSKGTVTQPTPTGPAPATPSPAPATGASKTETGRMLLDQLEGLPWWVYVLGALALSQFFNRGAARA